MSKPQIDNRSLIPTKPRSHRLAACLATALGLGGLALPAIGANIVVKACSDSNIFHPPLFLFGLRSSVASANDGDTIDMTELSHCTISLTDGEIPITVNNLTFTGPSNNTLTIDAHQASRIFNHTGTGGLTLSYLSLTNGYSEQYYYNSKNGRGGCASSKGSLLIEHSTVSACEATLGAALFSKGNTTLIDSVVTGNTADTRTGYPDPAPSAIYMSGTLVAKYSQISNNSGSGIAGTGNVVLENTTISNNRYGGGVFVEGNVTLYSSTIDGNDDDGIAGSGAVKVNSSTISNNVSLRGDGGGISISAKSGALPATLAITNSTISGNVGSGVNAYNTQLKISNSTIADNSAANKSGGIIVRLCSSFALQSSIIAGNVSLGGDQFHSDADVELCSVTGSNNLVGVLSFPLFGTVQGSAGLAPLGDHGGPVRTHALLSTSPAINAGSNPLNLATDERGAGFPRVEGAGIDIGSYERQTNDDEIFYNGFQ